MKTAFAPIESKESKVLILGTMPGERSIELNQYYGHKGNQFWKLMFDVFNQPFTDNYTERINLLTKNKIALWDVLSHCEREGSADSKIKNAIANNFALFFKKHLHIKHVFLRVKKPKNFTKNMLGNLVNLLITPFPHQVGLMHLKPTKQN